MPPPASLPAQSTAKHVTPFGGENHALLTHSCNPALLLLMSHQLYGRVPKRSYLLTIGAQSFVFCLLALLRSATRHPRSLLPHQQASP